MKKFKKYVAFFLFLVFLAGFTSTSFAAFVSPLKVYIHDGQTTASISITNNGDEPLVYTFEWERRVRTENGKVVKLLKEGETYQDYRPADPYLIYSPRRVVVEAGETQRVRILAQRPKDMAPGEYRSHLKISSESADPKPKAQVGHGEFGGVFTVRPAISIPVMLRTGKTIIDTKISAAQLVHDGNIDIANINILNNSTRSIYGTSLFKCKQPGGPEVTAKSNAFRLYVETKNAVEKFTVPEPVSASKCESLDLELHSSNEPEYDSQPIATAKLK